ncbi:peroxidase 2-like [Carex rostrata]
MGARNTYQILVFLSCIILFGVMSTTSLEVGYYTKCDKPCPQAELIMKAVVHKYIAMDPGFGAGVIRMFFHDCFVRGCDASILLDPSPLNPNPEKLSVVNNPSLRRFEVIDEAKETLERVCPNIVSCADIIAFVARDASYFLGRISYEIPSGRLDGRESIADEVLKSVPTPFHNLTVINAIFAAQGLSADDMVALSGAYSIGRSHCSSVTARLYDVKGERSISRVSSRSALQPSHLSTSKHHSNLTKTPASNNGKPPISRVSDSHEINGNRCKREGDKVEEEVHGLYPTIDPTMDQGFGSFLRTMCPQNANDDGVVPQDFVTPKELDNQYYHNVADVKGLFFSGWSLVTSGETLNLLHDFRTIPELFEAKFGESMVKMGNIGGTMGEIRKTCRVVNYNY